MQSFLSPEGLRRLLWHVGLLLCAALIGALVFLVVTDVAFGLGFYSHWAFAPAAQRGAVVGLLFELLRQLFPRFRPSSFLLLTALVPSLFLNSISIYLMSHGYDLPNSRSEAIRYLGVEFIYMFSASGLTGLAIYALWKEAPPLPHSGEPR